MNKRSLYKKRLRSIFFTILVLLIAFVFFLFERNISRLVKKNLNNYLSETALQYAQTFDVKIKDQLVMLESQTRYFADIDMNNYNQIKQTIMSTKGIGEFKRILVATINGMTINYDGKSSGNISMQEYFKKTIETAEPQISNKIIIDEDKEPVLSLAVPILQGGKAVGVICGTFRYNVLDELFSLQSFDGSGYSYVVDNDGEIIISCKSSNRLCFENNILDYVKNYSRITSAQLENIKKDVSEHKTGVININFYGKKRIYVYAPININNWYIVSALPDKYLQDQIVKISAYMATMLIVTLLLIVVSIAVINNLLKKADQIEKDKDRYTVAKSEAHSLIFEYDFKTQNLDFVGSTEFIFGKNIVTTSIDMIDVIFQRVHDDDLPIIDYLRAYFENPTEEFSNEIRILCMDKKYYWFKIAGKTVFDDDMQPMKFIGDLKNVDSQITAELNIVSMAERDEKSGLMNKNCLEKSVQKYLSANTAHLYAFYLIDLDDFKDVNVVLGHSAGDAVIKDVAKKLSLIFSTNDYIARIGGDEFAVLMCLDTSLAKNNALSIINEKASAINSMIYTKYSNEAHSVQVSASVGVVFSDDKEYTYKSLFKKADTALYTIKQTSKDDYAIFSDSMIEEEQPYD